MTTWAIRNDLDRARVLKVIEQRDMPCTVTVTKGAPRSIEQNQLQRKWLLEAQDQGDHTAEEYRAMCKLHFGVPILRNENDEFCEVYDRLIKPRSYEEKLELMSVPMDLPVTRIMTTKQKAAYLDEIYKHFTGLGYLLTVPQQEGAA